MKDIERLRALRADLPQAYLDELGRASSWERDFVDDEVHWYSPFVLWSPADALDLQPGAGDYPGLTDFFAVGSNGGLETFLIRTADGTIWVADLTDPGASLKRIADSFESLLGLLEPP